MSNKKEQLLEFLRESPNDPFLKYALVLELAKEGDKTKVHEGFVDLINNHEDYVGTYYHFGKFLESEGSLEKAVDIYRRGIEVARAKRNFHALGELQGALAMISDDADDDDWE